MSAETYGVTNIPGSSVTIRSGGTITIGAAFETTLGLVGGMDTANGDATPGEVTTVETTTDAEDAFGEDSELAEQVRLALSNSARTIYAVPVAETTGETQSYTGSQTGTLDEAPVFDSNIHDEHEITAQDTAESASVDVEMDYSSPPSTPSEDNTIALNPVTGEWEADESSDYDITYDFGDYADAIPTVVEQVPRIVGVLTENTSVANTLLSEISTYDVEFDFMHGVVGAMPDVSANDYSDSFDDRRLAVVTASRGYIDDAEEDEQRTVGAVAGKQSGKTLGDSTTYENLNGFTTLRTQYTSSEIDTLLDSQVLPLHQSGGIRVIRDSTTSTDPRFDRIAWSEITDEATEISHGISQDYVGARITDENLLALGESHRSSYREMEEDDLLDAFNVNVDTVSNSEVEVNIDLDLIGYMDNVTVTITVGDIVQNQGAA